METQPRSGMAVASLVLGIIALVTSVIPIINNLSFIMAIVGLILGIIGLVGIMHGKKTGKGLAIAGIVLTAVSFVVVLATQSLFSAALDQALENTGSSSNVQASGNATAESGNTAASASAEASDESDYAVTIDGCRTAKDYSGDPVAVITYTFTNNSDKDTSFGVALNPEVFQNGVELSTAIGSDWDSSKLLSSIKPGSTITIECGYQLEDESDITVEVSELISLNDVILAEATFSVS